MKKVTLIAALALGGCISINDSGVCLVREKTVEITATGYECLPAGRYKFCVERSPYSWYTGWLTVTEDRKYVFDAKEGK